MISEKVAKAINDQIKAEEHSSRLYFAMASWADTKGYPGAAAYLYDHADEERMHMIKFVDYLNERGGHASMKALDAPKTQWKDLMEVFTDVLNHEIHVTSLINNLYEICLEEKDYLTGNFLQWFIEEQIEEEASARNVLDKLNLASEAKGGLFHFDKEVEGMIGQDEDEG